MTVFSRLLIISPPAFSSLIGDAAAMGLQPAKLATEVAGLGEVCRKCAWIGSEGIVVVRCGKCV